MSHLLMEFVSLLTISRNMESLSKSQHILRLISFIFYFLKHFRYAQCNLFHSVILLSLSEQNDYYTWLHEK